MKNEQSPGLGIILILDENERRAQLVAGLLTFLGEDNKIVDAGSFATHCQPEEGVSACVLGALANGDHEQIVS